MYMRGKTREDQLLFLSRDRKDNPKEQQQNQKTQTTSQATQETRKRFYFKLFSTTRESYGLRRRQHHKCHQQQPIIS